MTTRRPNVVRHGQLELELPGLSDATVSDSPSLLAGTPAGYDVAFMHRLLCVSGMPHRRGSDRMNGTTSVFHRRGQGFSLKLITPAFEVPVENGKTISVPLGVPFGAKARLLVLWMASQAKANPTSTSRTIEIGHIKEWLTSIGIGTAGGAIHKSKDQLLRLCATVFSVSVREMLYGEDVTAFSNETLIEAGILQTEDMLHYRDGRLDKVRWPEAIKLTASAWRRFNTEVVPVPGSRLREIAHSSAAIDIFLYLCYRLPLIPYGEHETLTWKQMGAQFGSLGPDVDAMSIRPARHRESFDAAIRAVLRAYPEADVEVTGEGLVLRHSDPAVLRKAFVSGAALPPPKTTALRKRSPTRSLAMTG